MQIGANVTGNTIDAMIASAQQLEQQGFAYTGMANIRGHDAITALALVGQATSTIELHTAVVPTYPRHPVTMAQQALTAQAASGGRFTLGIGLSHKVVIEDSYGLSYKRTASHMREYLSVLMSLLRGEPTEFEGDEYRVTAGLDAPDADPIPCVVAALGPVMLGIAGELADGTVTWMCGPKTLETHIGPRIREAATNVGRPEPRVMAALPMAITSDPEGARAMISEQLAVYPTLPAYRAMMDIEGADLAGDIAIVGDQETVELELRRLEESGVTHFSGAVFEAEAGASARTMEFIASRA
ncbi:MAG TPA: TIGR03564 family F420-dependent LLM class oxidoreductase [Dehalococcoidia bacterium]|nr:TIGR03564 family F420-dependent LLM class oxidoreductase [Dehalococcoidia bacterium]